MGCLPTFATRQTMTLASSIQTGQIVIIVVVGLRLQHRHAQGARGEVPCWSQHSQSSTRPRPRTTTAHRRRRTATNGIPSPQLLPTLLVPSRPSAPAVSASHLCPHLSPRACPQVRRWTGSLRTYLRIACSIPSVSPSCSCPNASVCHSALHVPVCALPERHLHS